jgi:hypothetical protein
MCLGDAPLCATLARAFAAAQRQQHVGWSEGKVMHLRKLGFAVLLLLLFADTAMPQSKMRPDEAFWNTIRDKADARALQLFLQTFPDSPYADEAKAKIKAMNAERGKTSIDVYGLKDRELLNHLRASNALREGLWKGGSEESPCYVSVDWNDGSGAPTLAIVTHDQNLQNDGFGYSDFEISIKKKISLTAERDGQGGMFLKRQTSDGVQISHRLWYQFQYPHGDKEMQYFQVASGRDAGVPPAVASCAGLTHVSDNPAGSVDDVPAEPPEQSGGWTYSLQPSGEWSMAASKTIDGARLEFQCDGQDRIASYRVEDEFYPAEFATKEKLRLYMNYGKGTFQAELSAFKLSDSLVIGVGKAAAIAIAASWSAASSEIIAALREASDSPLQVERRFSARGSTKALETVMAHCGLR